MSEVVVLVLVVLKFWVFESKKKEKKFCLMCLILDEKECKKSERNKNETTHLVEAI